MITLTYIKKVSNRQGVIVSGKYPNFLELACDSKISFSIVIIICNTITIILLTSHLNQYGQRIKNWTFH